MRLPSPKDARGHEQQGARYAVVVQDNAFQALSTVIVAPTSRSARPASFRPEIEVMGELTRVMVEQLRAVDAQRLSRTVDHLTPEELWDVDSALALMLGLPFTSYRR
ncbi:MAG: type II toxin-antitoxin system PemK/MazF family toxin [Egibacteraceae bacterium]